MNAHDERIIGTVHKRPDEFHTVSGTNIYGKPYSFEANHGGYIDKDMHPIQIKSILQGLRATLGEGENPEDADIDAAIGYMETLEYIFEGILEPCADGLIEVHRATGIDLKFAADWLRLVQSVRPEFSIEGESPN